MKPFIAVPAIVAIVYRAWSHKSLTPLGLAVAAATAIVHALHPWSVFFALLGVFFLAGTRVTKVKHDVKARLTHSSSGSPGGEGPRNHVQVLANSVVATVLILAHMRTLRDERNRDHASCWRKGAWPRTGDVLVSGIVANYAAVAADTFSSELGILASSAPRLITAPWLTVAPGTNGGVTATGIHAGLLGSFVIAATATLLLPFCPAGTPDMQGTFARGIASVGWSLRERLNFMLAVTLLGGLGSLLDSLLGAVLQASVVDVRTGKVVEGEGGQKVLVHPSSSSSSSSSMKRDNGKGERASQHESRRIATGRDVLSNNGVNLLMAASISLVAVLGTAWVWSVPVNRILG